MLDQPGVYQMPLADYLADPAPEPSFSTSVAQTLLTQTPLHAYIAHPRLNPGRVRESSDKMDLGSICHSLLLEGDERRLVIIEADDFRTKVAKETRDEARAAGLIPILAGKMGQVHEIVKAAQSAIQNSELASAFKDGQPEQTLLWQEGATWCKSRPDWLTHDARIIIDLKTTGGSAEPNAWARGILTQNGYALQAALYLRGVKKLLNPRDCTFIFWVVETEPPYAASFVSLSPQYLEYADRQLSKALQLWGDCILTNSWPGYSPRVAYVDAPAYLLMQDEGNHVAL